MQPGHQGPAGWRGRHHRAQPHDLRRHAGTLLGYVTGLGVGAAYGLLRRGSGTLPAWAVGPLLGAAAMAGSDAPAAALGVTDPTSWDLTSGASDVVPHLAYGLTTASVYQVLR
ncbi:hypothetical protein ABT063_47475 [Streptomyces sp. NPDC002838]|uniref:hypothetical protein n=1 Tax=Streptomyces sp. NPDC002838 TaxID=3154436 RepID=UPI003318BF79